MDCRVYLLSTPGLPFLDAESKLDPVEASEKSTDQPLPPPLGQPAAALPEGWRVMRSSALLSEHVLLRFCSCSHSWFLQISLKGVAHDRAPYILIL